MKQIDIIKTWSKKRCLIVDDIADVRASVKRWLVDFGCNEVDTAGNADEAIDLCQRHHYDMILADYNLGQGKNGQQLLEEVRFHKLVSNTALFIMITAEATSHYVLHALEYQPDDYLSKPLNRNALQKRLDNAMLKNEALYEIKAALDEHAIEKAILAAERKLEMPDKYTADVRRALGDLYCENLQWSQALDLYQNTEQSTTVLWCRLGSARALIGLEHFTDAEHILEKVIEEFPLCVEARDLLARLFQLQDKVLQQQEVLAKAVQISPRSSQRQREFGFANSRTGEHSLAVQAWRSALRYSKNTCQEKPEDYLQLTGSLNDLASESRPAAIPELSKEALEILKQVEKKYPRNPLILLRSKQLRAEIFELQGKMDKYEEELQAASAINIDMDYKALRTASVNLCVDCARTFMNHAHYEEGEKLLAELAKLTSDPVLSIQIDKLRRDPQTREGITYASTLNKSGIEYYDNKEYELAQLAFEKVLKELPNHTGLNLNLLQTLIAKIKQEGSNEKDLHVLNNCLRRVAHIDSDSPHFKRYQYLLDKCASLQNKDSTFAE